MDCIVCGKQTFRIVEQKGIDVAFCDLHLE